jgi:6-phosphogluconolactonase
VAEFCYTPKEEVPQRAGAQIAAALRECIARSGRARFAISGGSATSPLPFVRQELGEQWKAVKLTWVDERCVDFSDADSNRGAAYRSGALSEDDKPGYELPLWLDGEKTEEAMSRVRQHLADEFDNALDLALLGMGPDGHIASLFPGHPVLSLPEEQLVAAISDSPKPPPERMTLTRSLLVRSGKSILVALGEAKAPALERLRQADPALPASHLPNLSIVTNLDIGESV